MNLYLDSSALIKRYIEEPGTEQIEPAIGNASALTAAQITFVETMRVVASDPAAARKAARDWSTIDVIGLTPALCERAVGLSVRHGLKSMDAIQLASALTASGDLTFATFDRRLHAAAQAEGFETLPASLS